MKKWGIEHYVPGPERAEANPLSTWDRFLEWALNWLLGQKKLRRKRRLQPAWDQPAPAPRLLAPKYDVENLRRYNRIIEPGDNVYITEKIHGCNARFVFHDGKMYVGSRTQWKKKHNSNIWWRALEQHPWIEEWCKTYPDHILYGEVFGQVQDLKYDTEPGELEFLAFDIYHDGEWLNFYALENMVSYKHRVPLLYVGLFDKDHAEKLAEEQSSLAKHCREGVVICTTMEERHPKLGRKQLKIVGNRYMERGK
jgi:RNA ligase (TIGR02306 family)